MLIVRLLEPGMPVRLHLVESTDVFLVYSVNLISVVKAKDF